MQRLSLCCGLILSLLAGCSTGSRSGDDPPVTPAPPLKPGVVSLAPNLQKDDVIMGGPQTSIPPLAPDTYLVKFETTKGNFVVEVHREWAPLAADRFKELVEAKYYDGVKFFRAVSGFMVQFGISGDPAANSVWRDNRIPDDKVTQTNARGTITFATSGPNARTTQVFINYENNPRLDGMGFAPFGKIIEGMDVVDALNQEYGEEPSKYQGRIQEQGNAFLEQAFPRLDGILSATIVAAEPSADDEAPADAAALKNE